MCTPTPIDTYNMTHIQRVIWSGAHRIAKPMSNCESKSKVVVKIGDFRLPFAHFFITATQYTYSGFVQYFRFSFRFGAVFLMNLQLNTNSRRRRKGEKARNKNKTYMYTKMNRKILCQPKSLFDGKRKEKICCLRNAQRERLFMYIVRKWWDRSISCSVTLSFCIRSVCFVSSFFPPTIFFFLSFHCECLGFPYLRSIRVQKCVCVCHVFLGLSIPFHFVHSLFRFSSSLLLNPILKQKHEPKFVYVRACVWVCVCSFPFSI